MVRPPRDRSRIVVAVVLAIVMAVPVSLSVGMAKNAEAAPALTTLRIGFMQKIDSLNPFVGVNDAAYVFYGLVYDALDVIDNKMNPSPDLALSSWAVPASDPELVANHEPYGSVWQYNLTHDATWTDGEPFTADDVVFNVNMNAGNYTILWAYQPYSYWMKHAEKIDDYTVRIHFYNKATGLPTPAAYGYLISVPMLPKHLLQGLDPAYININWSGVFSNQSVPIVGTGPFMVTPSIYNDFVSGNTITLVRNPNSHWEKQYGKIVHFDRIQLVFYDDATAMSLALRKGDIDVSSFPPQAFLQIQQDIASGILKNVTTYDGPKITQYWTEVGINMNASGGNEARLDPAVRHAMAMATDKNFICQQFYLGMATPGSTLIPPINSYWHYNLTDAEKFPLNYTLANETLQNAGYVWNYAHTVRVAGASSLAVKDGWVTEGKPLTFDILVRQDYPEEKDIATYLQYQWGKIGIHINLDIVDEATLNTIVYKYQYDFMIWYWSADKDPNYQLFVQTSMAIKGWSDNHYSNPAYDQNYTNSVMAMNRPQRKVYVDNCQRINYEDAGYIILAYPNQTYAWRTDTFAGWGDWAANPGRSIDNYWMGNPLYFDLMPLQPGSNMPPVILDFYPTSNVKTVGREVVFTSDAYDTDGDNLTQFVEFGDGSSAQRKTPGTLGIVSCEFSHVYSSQGNFTVSLWVDDGNGTAGHNVSASTIVAIVPDYNPVIQGFAASPNPVAAGRQDSFVVSAIDIDGDNLSYFITFGDGQAAFVPSYGSFSGLFYHIYADVGDYTATLWVDDGNTTPGHNVSASTVVHAVIDAPPSDLQLQVSPNPANAGSGVLISARANDTDGDGLSFFIEFGDGQYDSASTAPGPVMKAVMFNHTYSDAGNYTVTLWVDDGNGSIGHNISISASISIRPAAAGPTSIDYRWYDMFNVPFESYWSVRAPEERIITHTYPYIYAYEITTGNIHYYSDLRLNMTAKNLTSVSTSTDPVFFPQGLFNGFQPLTKGGTMTVDWSLDYPTMGELNATPWGTSLNAWFDGWITELKGSVTLDWEAALSVLGGGAHGLTPTILNSSFASWWAGVKSEALINWHSWLDVQGGPGEPYDIYPMYGSDIDPLVGSIDAVKVGNNVVLTIDDFSWGMECLMARWLHHAFNPTEWYMYDFNMTAVVGPEVSDVQVDTACMHALYAYETVNIPMGQTKGEPDWVFEPCLGDDYYSRANQAQEHSEMDSYKGLTYVNHAPGSAYYGLSMPWDYTPAAFNLSANDTMTFEWPAGNLIFYKGIAPYQVAPVYGTTSVLYGEPIDKDMPTKIKTDIVNRTVTFTGPIDMWNWSKTQTADQDLVDMWSSIGGRLLPRGAPYIEFQTNGSTPVARFTVTPTSCNITTLLLFNASTSTDPREPASNLTYRWDFDGNGIFDTSWSSASTTQHRYAAPGHYAPELEVKNSKGYVGFVVGSVTVMDLPPLASFVVSPAGGPQTQMFTFNASSSSDLEDGTAILLVRWDWEGDGVWDIGWTTVKTASHQFPSPGTYTVKLQVKDSAGLVNTTTRLVVVSPLVIPEFPSVLVPILGMISLMAATVIFRRRRWPI